MKLAAINEINKLSNESAVKEILDHLVKISKGNNMQLNTDVFFNKAADKYDDVLRKLAQ